MCHNKNIIAQPNQLENTIKMVEKDLCEPKLEADDLAHTLIVSALQELTPGYAVLSEEGLDETLVAISDDGHFGVRKDVDGAYITKAESDDETKTDYYWIIDPLDGSSRVKQRIEEAIAGKGDPYVAEKTYDEYAINISLIHKGEPVLGVIHHPRSGETYCGIHSEEKQQAFAEMPDGSVEPFAAKPFINTYVTQPDFFMGQVWGESEKVQHLLRSPPSNALDGKTLRDSMDLRKGKKHTIPIAGAVTALAEADGPAAFFHLGIPDKIWDTAALVAIAKAAGNDVLPMNSWKEAPNFEDSEKYEKTRNFIIGHPELLKIISTNIEAHIAEVLEANEEYYKEHGEYLNQENFYEMLTAYENFPIPDVEAVYRQGAISSLPASHRNRKGRAPDLE